MLPPLGITFQEFLNTDESSELLALDMGKVSHAGFTGEDMGGGRQLLIDVKRCGDNVDHPDRVHYVCDRIRRDGEHVSSNVVKRERGVQRKNVPLGRAPATVVWVLPPAMARHPGIFRAA